MTNLIIPFRSYQNFPLLQLTQESQRIKIGVAALQLIVGQYHIYRNIEAAKITYRWQ